MKKILVLLITVLVLVGCNSKHDVASHNIKKEADEFRVHRRIVFYNAITDTYMLEVIGNCAIDLGRSNVLEVTCRVGEEKFQKHYLGLSDNVTYTVEQLEFSEVDEYRYELIFKPKQILPIKLNVE